MKHKCNECGTPIGFKGSCWQCRSAQERNEVLAWTDEEIASKVEHLIANADKLKDWDSDEFEVCSYLVEVRGIYSPALQRAALAANAFSLEHLYYEAPADVRDGLISLLNAEIDPHDAGELMTCLAMQGDDVALQALLELELNPRPWRQQLYVDPSVYAQAGGWTFDKDGNRRNLNAATCYALEKGGKGTNDPVNLARIRQDLCPHCSCQLVDMFVLDGREERLQFLGIDGILTASGCPNCCSMTEAVFNRFTLDGGSTPIFPYSGFETEEENYIGEEELNKLCSNSFILGKTPVPVFYGLSNDDLNTIGGFASWVQDWEYMPCPDCSKPMKYVAQIQWDTILDYNEGTLYIEVCSDCSIASMHHQQT